MLLRHILIPSFLRSVSYCAYVNRYDSSCRYVDINTANSDHRISRVRFSVLQLQ